MKLETICLDLNIINLKSRKMKKVYLLTLVAIVLFSCSKNSEQINIVKMEIEKRMSDVEKNDIQYTCIEISDKEALTEIAEYHKQRQEKAQKECDNFMKENELGKYRTIPLEQMSDSKLTVTTKLMQLGESICNEVSRHQNSYSEDLEKLSKLKGENRFYKIEAIKKTPDTILHKKVYLDNNNEIISTQYLK